MTKNYEQELMNCLSQAVIFTYLKCSQEVADNITAEWRNTIQRCESERRAEIRKKQEEIDRAQRLCRDFLHLQVMATLDPSEACARILANWGIVVDWREMSRALEDMVAHGSANYDGWSQDQQRRYLIGARRIEL